MSHRLPPSVRRAIARDVLAPAWRRRLPLTRVVLPLEALVRDGHVDDVAPLVAALCACRAARGRPYHRDLARRLEALSAPPRARAAALDAARARPLPYL